MRSCAAILLLACATAANASMLLVVTSDNASPEFNGRVLRYDGETGEFIDVFFRTPLTNEKFDGIELGPDGYIYASSSVFDSASGDPAGGRILRFDPLTGGLVDEFIPLGQDGLSTPIGMAFDEDGSLYVANNLPGPGFDEILKFTGGTGSAFTSFASVPQEITFGPDGNLYVANAPLNGVYRYDGDTGAFIDVFASGGGLDAPTGIAFGPDGDFYVANFPSNNILRFDGETGAFIDEYVDSLDGRLDTPIDFAFGPDGDLYVNSRSREGTGPQGTVLRYSGLTGDFIDVLVEPGSGGYVVTRNGMLFLDGPATVPEPSTLAIWSLLGLTTGAASWLRRRCAV